MPYSSPCHRTLCPTRPRVTALYALLVPVSPHSMPYASPCHRTLCPTRPCVTALYALLVPALYALLVPVSQHSMPYLSPHSMPYSSPCHSTLCPTRPRVTALYALLVPVSQHSMPYSSPCHSTLCPTRPRVTALYALLVPVSQHSMPYSSPYHSTLCPTRPRVTALYALLVNISHNTSSPSLTQRPVCITCFTTLFALQWQPYICFCSQNARVPRLTTLCAPQGCCQSSTSLHTLCVPHVSQHCVPYSCTSTSSQTAPHRSHNKWCPTVVPHLHLHKLRPTGLTTNGAPQWYLIYTSTNWAYPTCLTTKLCTPHVSQNSVYPTCLTTKLCVPHTSHNKTMCTPHVSQQNYVYPTCLTTKLCVLHTSDKNLGPTVVLHSSRTHHTLCVCAFADSESSFPAPSSKLCRNWLRQWRGTLYLRAAVHRQSAPSEKDLGTKTELSVKKTHKPQQQTNKNTRILEN